MLPPPTIPSRSANVSEQSISTSSSASLSSQHFPSAAATPGRSSNNHIPTRSFVWTERTYVSHGVFAGRHMKFHLEVAQEPIHGRRKTEKDRRPLAHCPIVRLRMRECRRITDTSFSSAAWEEGWEESELDVSMVESSNFICAAELDSPNVSVIDTPSSTSRTHTSIPGDPFPDSRRPNIEFPKRPPPAPLSVYPSRSVDGDVTMGRNDRSSPEIEAGPSSQQRIRRLQDPSHATSSPDVLRTAHDAPNRMPPVIPHETQESKEQRRQKTWGRNLYGNAHVVGIRVPAPEGGLGLWFLFTDLSVRHEGSYALHFRCFDITAVASESPYPSPPLVATTSQSFKVYSPRNFPGIPKPTELAEHFNRLGFKLNTRKNERIADITPSTTPTRRPSPHPVQHHDGESHGANTASSSRMTTGQQSINTTGTGSSSGTETGTITDLSSASEGLLSGGGSGGMPGMPGGLPDMGRRGSR